MSGRPAAWAPVLLSDLGQALASSQRETDAGTQQRPWPWFCQPRSRPPGRHGEHGPVGRAVQSCVCSRQAPKCRHRGGRVPPPRRPGCRGHLWLLRSFLNAIASLREKAPGEARRLSDSSLPRARLRRLLSPACFPGQWPPGRQSQTVVPDPVEEGRGHSISRPLTVKTGSPPTLGRTRTGQ